MADGEHGFTICPTLLHPGRRGSVRLRSARAEDPPRVDPAYLSHPDDMATYLAGVRLTFRLTASPAMAHLTDGRLRIDSRTCAASPCGCPPPGAAGGGGAEDAAVVAHWECMVRTAASTVYHPAGTARMGADGDPLAVLDERLRVRGVAGLRVADASAMPKVPSGNTNAAVFMIAERAADMIKADLAGGGRGGGWPA